MMSRQSSEELTSKELTSKELASKELAVFGYFDLLGLGILGYSDLLGLGSRLFRSIGIRRSRLPIGRSRWAYFQRSAHPLGSAATRPMSGVQ